MHPPTRLIACLALSLFAPSLVAQITAELRTATDFGNFARDGSRQDFRSWPLNTALAQGQSSIGALADNAFADTIVGWQVWSGNVVTADVSDQGGGSVTTGPMIVGSTPSPSSSNVQQGPHALVLRLRGSPGTRGKIEAWATGLAQPGSAVRMAVDLGDDQTVDFQVDATASGNFDRRQWNVALDGNGELKVRIITDARAVLPTGSTIYKTGVSVRFTPGTFCDITGYGTSCGPRLSGADDLLGQARELTLYLAEAAPSSPGLLVLGTQRWSVPIPGTQCLLQTDPVVALPFATDANGFAQRRLRAPLGPALAVNLQDAVLVGLTRITTSNGLAIACR